MEKRKLGPDGPWVTPIGLGCWSFGGAYGATTREESLETLKCALDLGIDHLDTANVYGNGVSETVIGEFIKDHPDRFHIATKAAIWRDPDTNVRGFNNSPQHLRTELEKSLKRLGVDHVALFYIHRREAERPIEEVMDTLVTFKKEGKIGGIGFSEISPATLRRAQKVHPVAAVQNEYSLWSRMPDLGLIRACRELDVAFVPFSPLGRGMFTKDIPDPDTFPNGHFRKGTPRFTEPNFSFNVAAIQPFKDFAIEIGTTPAALALAWCLDQGDHLIPIPGTRSATHLRDNLSALTLELTSDHLAEIDRILPPGFAHGDRYSWEQLPGAERYC